jgi:hypothetical protein
MVHESSRGAHQPEWRRVWSSPGVVRLTTLTTALSLPLIRLTDITLWRTDTHTHTHTQRPSLTLHTTTSALPLHLGTLRFDTRSRLVVLNSDRHRYRPPSCPCCTIRRASLQPLYLPQSIAPSSWALRLSTWRPPSLSVNPPPADHVRCTSRCIIPDSLQRYYTQRNSPFGHLHLGQQPRLLIDSVSDLLDDHNDNPADQSYQLPLGRSSSGSPFDVAHRTILAALSISPLHQISHEVFLIHHSLGPREHIIHTLWLPLLPSMPSRLLLGTIPNHQWTPTMRYTRAKDVDRCGYGIWMTSRWDNSDADTRGHTDT